MSRNDEDISRQLDDAVRGRSVSRREFLKIAGIAGATVSIGAGLGGLLAACGGGATTTTAGATTTTAGATTTTAGATTTTAGATTTVSSGGEAGRDIKIGIVSPKTGVLAAFATADGWWVDHATKATADGVAMGDGKLHKFKITVLDSQSDTNRAAQVAGDLIQNQKVDVVLTSGSPDTVSPVADQCEAAGTPCLCSFTPWQAFYYGRGATAEKGFKWTYAHSLGWEQAMNSFLDMWPQVPNNKVVGMVFANDADGLAWTDKVTGLGPYMNAAGYTQVMPSLFQPGTEDFTTYISEFKKKGCEILTGVMFTPEFTNLWKQCLQQGFHPKLASMNKALLFPQTVEAIGPAAYNLLGEVAWHPTWPFKDSLTGMTCQQLADDFETKTGQQWSCPIGQYGKFEWVVDVFKRTPNVDDKEAVIQAVATTNTTTILGPIDFTAPVDPKGRRPVPNVVKPYYGGGQWVKGTKWPFDLAVTSNVESPDAPVQAKVQPMQYQ